MKQDGYILLCEVLEMNLGKALKHAGKRIGKRMIKDPAVLATAALPIPGSIGAAPVVHFARNKRSRDMGRVVVRKLLDPRRWGRTNLTKK